ncbi:MAG: SH3 domain-containing protein, partial [Butyrivibrio sp.]|nr:SH3 domain-containing protein [Butyrivibrio sp.]
ILVMIGMIFKKKVFDSVVIPDPDSETNVSVGEMAGYTATNDVIVTTAELNLRNTPSTASDEYVVVQVPAGTELSRKYVKDDGEWAQVEYEGQTLYCVMKYAKVKE